MLGKMWDEITYSIPDTGQPLKIENEWIISPKILCV